MMKLIEIIEQNIEKALEHRNDFKQDKFDYYIALSRYQNKELIRDYGFSYGQFKQMMKKEKVDYKNK